MTYHLSLNLHAIILSMKKGLLTLIIYSTICLSTQLGFCQEAVNLGPVEKENLQFKPAVTSLKGSLLISETQVLDELIKLQSEKDMEDLDILWKGTVENNQVIGFALKKLATPESQRRIHSSLMAKTLSAVVSGASFAPSLMGADPYIQTTAFAAGRLAQTLLNRKTMPQEIPLTDTELIELASLVETLQDKLINAYYNYKNCLSQLKESRSRLVLYNKNYAKALEKNDVLDIAVSSALYDEIILQEYENKQHAKKYYLELQRLAGKKSMAKLNIYQYNFNATLFEQKGVK